MATTIKLKNGSGAPLAGDLVQGEPALDLTNKRLYSEDSVGTVIEIGTNPSTIDINAGTIDGTVIGGSSAAAGTFTTVTATGGSSTNWNTAYGWGNHASAGYLTGNQTITLSGDLSGSGTTSIAASIVANSVGADELNVSGNGTTAQFLRSDGDGSFSWATPTDTNTTYSAGSGLDLVGTTFSIESDLRGEAWLIGRDSNDYINVNTTVIDFVLDGNLDMRLENDGDLHVDGNVVAYSTTTSDSRLKDNVTTIDNALTKVCSMRGVEFDWNATSRKGQHDVGVIAQEMEQVVPYIVRDVELQTGEFAGSGFVAKTVDYEKLCAVLIEAVKELNAKVDSLIGA